MSNEAVEKLPGVGLGVKMWCHKALPDTEIVDPAQFCEVDFLRH